MRRHALLIICLTLLLPRLAAAASHYTVTDLGIGEGYGISNSGQVTGLGRTTSDAPVHAFLYNGTTHDLGTLGGTQSIGYGINDGGQVTGYDISPGVPQRGFIYDSTMHDLGLPRGTSASIAYDINNSGQVTGFGSTIGAFLWTPTTPGGASGTVKSLGTLGGTSGQGRSINDSGQVTGYSYTVGGSQRAFLWTPTSPNGASGTMVDLGTLGLQSIGQAINANGQVAGTSIINNKFGPRHAFLWTPTTTGGASGAMVDLGTLAGSESIAQGINASGQVTGWDEHSLFGGSPPFSVVERRAFVYDAIAGMVDLNSLIDPDSGWYLQVGHGINDTGQITGFGVIGGEGHAFLLTPVPEPSSLLLAALGVLCAFAYVSRRRPFGSQLPPRRKAF